MYFNIYIIKYDRKLKRRQEKMILYIPKSEREEITQLLFDEGVTFHVGDVASIRELGTGSYEVFKVEANLVEVDVPPMYRASEGDVRAFRLPSGKLILTDLEGNLERIEMPLPGK
jgi:hypothetical protein